MNSPGNSGRECGSPPAGSRRGILARVKGLVLDQLKQGISPAGVATTISVGVAVGVFPVLGTTTIIAFVAGLLLRLNQPLLQAVNYSVYPLQIPLIYVFVRAGEWITGARPVSFSVSAVMSRFGADPLQFLADFGRTGLHGIAGWAAIALPLCAFARFALVPVLRRIPVLEVKS